MILSYKKWTLNRIFYAVFLDLYTNHKFEKRKSENKYLKKNILTKIQNKIIHIPILLPCTIGFCRRYLQVYEGDYNIIFIY